MAKYGRQVATLQKKYYAMLLLSTQVQEYQSKLLLFAALKSWLVPIFEVQINPAARCQKPVKLGQIAQKLLDILTSIKHRSEMLLMDSIPSQILILRLYNIELYHNEGGLFFERKFERNKKTQPSLSLPSFTTNQLTTELHTWFMPVTIFNWSFHHLPTTKSHTWISRDLKTVCVCLKSQNAKMMGKR